MRVSEVRKLTKSLWDSGRCGAGDSKICLIAFVEDDNDTSLGVIKRVMSRYERDPVDFYFVNINEQSDFIQAFPKFERGRDKVILFKPQRRKYGLLEGEVDTEKVAWFIDEVLAGSKAGYFIRDQHLVLKSR